MKSKLHALKLLAVALGPFVLVSAVYGVAPADAHGKYWGLVSLVSAVALFGGIWLAGKLDKHE